MLGAPGIVTRSGLGGRRSEDISGISLDTVTMTEEFTYTATNGLGVAVQTAFYVPSETGSHTFYATGSCIVELYMSYPPGNAAEESITMNPANKVSGRPLT